MYFVFYAFYYENAAVNELSNRHTITIDDKTFQKLKSRGNFGETYSELISRIIKDSDAYNGLMEG